MYRQLPEFRRLAYPVRAEVTKHVLPGRKSPGCPAAVCAAVGTTWGATQNWRPEHKEISAAPKYCLRTKSFQADYSREADPKPFVGKADDTAEETGKSTLWDRRGMGSSIQGKILGDNVGKVQRAAGTGDNLRRLLQRGKTEVEERPLRLANESVVAKKEE